MRVGVVGAGGNMGREACRTLSGQPDIELVAAVDPAHGGTVVHRLIGTGSSEVVVSTHLGALEEAGTEVVVDFTRIDVARQTLAHCATEGMHAVVGTTGFTDADLGETRRLFGGPGAGSPNCIVASNFAIGAVLMEHFAALAAPWFDGAEIVELHHDAKLDAPSGTSMRTAERMAEARRGAGGGSGPGGVRIHSVRLPGLVAHQEVILGAVGQSLTIRHDSFDRVSFMDGVVLAVRAVPDRPGVTLGIDSLLGL